jgi:hypothetical protein
MMTGGQDQAAGRNQISVEIDGHLGARSHAIGVSVEAIPPRALPHAW